MKSDTSSKHGQQPRQPLTDSSATLTRIGKLEARVRELLAERDGGKPIWIRAPKSKTEFYTGFSRAKLYALAAEGSIRSTSIREPGQVKGTRLFNLQSILAFIEQNEATAAKGGNS